MMHILIAMSSILAANPSPSDFRAVDDLINDSIARGETPGAVLLVATRDKTVYLKAYGNRGLQPATQPMTADTVFDLASLTKPVATATSIMILVERGQIALQDPLAKYIPDFAENGKDSVTIEQLLLHRGGLIPDNPLADYAEGPEVSMQKINALKLRSTPGTKFEYTDVGYILLGQLVRVVDGRRLDRFAAEEIFGPLGMTQTMFLPDSAVAARCAPTEQRDGHWMKGEVHDPRAYALGGVAGHAGLFGTAEDLAKYCRMFIGGRGVLKKETIGEMIKLRELPNGTGGRGYGFDITSSFSGCRGDRFEKGTTFGHTGFTGTMFWIDPKNECFFILLTNRVHPDGKGDVKNLRRSVATEVAETLLDGQ